MIPTGKVRVRVKPIKPFTAQIMPRIRPLIPMS